MFQLSNVMFAQGCLSLCINIIGLPPLRQGPATTTIPAHLPAWTAAVATTLGRLLLLLPELFFKLVLLKALTPLF